MLFQFNTLRPLSRTATQYFSKATTPAYRQRFYSSSRSDSVLQLGLRPRLLPLGISHQQQHIQIHRRGRSYSTPMAAPTDTAAEEVANNTGITPDTLAQTLREKLEATHVEIQDISGGCGASFTALIVSPQFQGKAALARHRLVNSALKAEIAAIHAWTPKCLTPEQWEQQKSQQ